MAKKLTDGKISIGAYMFPDRKKPCLCVEEGNQIVVYGHFNTVEGADKFIDILGMMVGASFEGGQKMETPFKNDPFCMVWMAYKRLYDKPCEIWWDYHEEDAHEQEYGFTHFPNDGSTPTVIIYSDHPVAIQVETLAHELAHVAVGVEHEHDSVWDEAFTAINEEYHKIGDEMFGGTEDGK